MLTVKSDSELGMELKTLLINNELDLDSEPNKSLIPLTGKFPYNAEIESNSALLEGGFITPVELCFVRNHGSVPELEWSTHTLQVDYVDQFFSKTTKEFSMNELKAQFDLFTVAATFACNGNRRKELNMVKDTLEFNWGAGAVSNSYYSGIRLRDLINSLSLSTFSTEGLFVHFEGCDDLPNGKYGTCISYDYAMGDKNDIVLAFEQNFEPLTRNHGYPLRLVIPGFIGGRNIKWLSKIRITQGESDNWYHIHDNRRLPGFIETFRQAEAQGYYTKSNKNYKYGYLNELVIQSIITHPKHGSKLSLKKDEGKYVEVKGYAYNGGGREISKIEISIDNGETWEEAKIEYQRDNKTKGDKVWVWCFFYKKIRAKELINKQFIKVKATDKENKTQKNEKLQWSLKGFFNNSIYKLKVNYNISLNELTFLHPVQPGKTEDLILKNKAIGWMEKEKISKNKQIETITKQIFPLLKQFTITQIKKHNKSVDCLVVIDCFVYDLSLFLKIHPGGSKIIQNLAGSDCSLKFKKAHPKLDMKKINKYKIGYII